MLFMLHRHIVQDEFRGIEPKALVISIGGFFGPNWF